MTTTTEDRPTTEVNERRLPFSAYSAIAVVIASIGVFWPGGHVPMADQVFTLAVLAAIYSAVTRNPGFRGVLDGAPVAAKRGVTIVLGVLLIGQLWGVSAHTFPIASWTMYAVHPGDEAAVFRFDAVNADGESVEFMPSASHRTLPAKMALVHLRRLSDQLYVSSLGSDADQLAAVQDLLRRTIVAYVEIDGAKSPDGQPVSVVVSRVTYDVTQERVAIDSGVQTVLMQIDLEAS